MELTVKRWGNSLALRIPSKVADQVNLTEDTVVQLDVRDGRIIVERKPTFSLDALLDELEAGAELDPLVDWGPPVGKEFGSPDET